MVQSGGTKTVAIGWSAPLRFASELKLSVVVLEDGVAQVVANVVAGGAEG